MTDPIMLAHAFERIGSLEQRLSSLEIFLSGGQLAPPQTDMGMEEMGDATPEQSLPIPPHRFNYPIKAVPDDLCPDIMELRKIRYAQYKVTIMQPFVDPPQKVYTTMTRDELDDYLKSNPGENFGEWIVEIHMEGV